MAGADFEKTEAYSGPEIQLSTEKEAQYAQIMRNLQEATSSEIVRKVLSEGEVVRCYWGERRLRDALHEPESMLRDSIRCRYCNNGTS